jgi:ribonucleoside-diphosphate reductase alpha chain
MNVFTYNEALKSSLEYFDNDYLAAKTLVSKYLLKNEKGEFLELNPNDMHRRLAKEFARVENKYPNPLSEDEIYNLQKDFKYIVAQGSPMSAIGNSAKIQSLSNCFVIASPSDSYGSIVRADEEVLQLQKRRGGVGLDLSNIRPKGVPVRNAADSSDGIAIFMERYSNTTREVAQGGRRGALMETIDVSHPDIEQFITIKQDRKRVTGANVSIRVTDKFMKCVAENKPFTLQWPVDVPLKEARLALEINAKDLWNKMMFAAWDSAEPGIIYWDTVIRNSMSDEFADKGFKTVCTNPCSELPLSAYGSCRLLLLNLFSYVTDPFTKNAKIDYKKFEDHSMKAQRLMDDLVDLEIEAIERIIAKIKSDPESEEDKLRELSLWTNIKKACENGRRTGTGITALGDMLAALNLTYGSKESIEVTEEVYKTLAVATHASSVILAQERGAFPAWEAGRYKNAFAKRLNAASSKEIQDLFSKTGRRNIALTTTAPAGSVSILTRTTSGIEPAFLLHYTRRKKVSEQELSGGSTVDFADALGDRWQEFDVYHPKFKMWKDVSGLKAVEDSPYYKSTSNDIDWLASVELLAAAQKWTEHSISKTINLPKDATIELVSDVYFKAWELGIKGVTVYRDGSRDGVLLNVEDETEAKISDQPIMITDTNAPKRPAALPCDIHRVNVKSESYLVIVGLLNNRPYEIFAGLSEYVEVPKKVKSGTLIKGGKTSSGLAKYNLNIPYGDDDEMVFKDVVKLFDNPLHGAFTRTISLVLRHGVPIQYLVEQLRKDKNSDMTSFSAVIARVLSKHYIPDGTDATVSEKVCLACGSNLLSYQQGCVACMNCGSSKCS